MKLTKKELEINAKPVFVYVVRQHPAISSLAEPSNIIGSTKLHGK